MKHTLSIIDIKFEEIECNIGRITCYVNHFWVKPSQMEGKFNKSSQSYLLCKLEKKMK